MRKRTFEITSEGQYTWNLLFDIDNCDGTNDQSIVNSVTHCTRVSRVNAIKELTRVAQSTNPQFRDVVQDDSTVELLSAGEEVVENTSETVHTGVIAAGTRKQCYQLQFMGVGMFGLFSTKVTEPVDVPTVRITCVLEVTTPIPMLTQGPAHLIEEGVYGIKSEYQTFIRSCDGVHGEAKVDTQTFVGAWEEFVLVHIPDTNRYAFRTKVHETHLFACPGGDGSRVTTMLDRDKIETQFVIVPTSRRGRFAIRSCHGTYIRAHQGGEGSTVDLCYDRHDWEAMNGTTFEFVRID